MELLKQRIKRDGIAISQDVLLVDSFLNHQVDVFLMREIGREFAAIFRGAGITRVATIESSGIAPAVMCALEMGLPMVTLKKSTSSILSEEILQTGVFSFTKGSGYQLTLKSRFIQPDDCVLIIDDFLANGEAALGAARLVNMAGARVGGIGIVIEKAFQKGRKRLIEAGYNPVSLAVIERMERGNIEFAPDGYTL